MTDDPAVHVIDDDKAVRDSLEFLFRSAEVKVKTYDSGQQFLSALPLVAGGCIVCDIRMPGLGGIELLQCFRDLDIRLPVIMITGHADVARAVESMKLGAVDFFEKPFDDDRLLTAVRNAMTTQDQGTLRGQERIRLRGRLATLSGRERQVLKGLMAGLPNKTIAFDLGISSRTVEIYRANVMSKMRASSLSELIRLTLLAGDLAAHESEGPNPDVTNGH